MKYPTQFLALDLAEYLMTSSRLVLDRNGSFHGSNLRKVIILYPQPAVESGCTDPRSKMVILR